MLPNKSPAIALPLDRAPFVKTEHTVEFQADGSLKSVSTKRPSSALKLISWPLDVYRAVLNATSELITLRIGAKDAEINLAKKELEAQKEFKKINDELAALQNPLPDFAPTPKRTTTLLSIPLGRAKVDEILPDNQSKVKNSGDMSNQQVSCKPGDPCPSIQKSAGGK